MIRALGVRRYIFLSDVLDSILDSTKARLGIDKNYHVFDNDLIPLINGVLMVLNQLGIGEKGFAIMGSDEEWSDFIGDRTDVEAIKTYVYLKSRLVFDPPASSTVLTSIEKQCEELEWRINAQVDYLGESG